MIRLFNVNGLDELPRLRMPGHQADVTDVVKQIVDTVRRDGDSAIQAFSRFDFGALNGDCARFEEIYKQALKAFEGSADTYTPEVSHESVVHALDSLDTDFRRVLTRAAENITRFHERQKRSGFILETQDGAVMGQRVLPLDRVGIYVPGGTAPYPSTVLMTAIPAKLAGVREVYMASPPGADGRIPQDILAAAALAGVDRVYAMGGAQAVAAFAYGTDMVPCVDKIVGPGNIFVQTAKRLVFGQVDIDMIAGPSDILVIADNTAVAEYVAADLLSQAEHDTRSQAVLVTVDKTLAENVRAQLDAQLAQLPRREIAAQAIENNSAIIVTDTLEHAAQISNSIAPEHLELCVAQPFALLPLIRHAGSIFLGNHAPEALGDYIAGPNHTLPTEGTARFASPLSVDDYYKKSSFIYYPEQAFKALAGDAAGFAMREGLDAHARSVTIRSDNAKGGGA